MVQRRLGEDRQRSLRSDQQPRQIEFPVAPDSVQEIAAAIDWGARPAVAPHAGVLFQEGPHGRDDFFQPAGLGSRRRLSRGCRAALTAAPLSRTARSATT